MKNMKRLSYISHIEWQSDCSVIPLWPIFQAHHGENQLIFDEMIMMSILY
jgi:hypothetical protein